MKPDKAKELIKETFEQSFDKDRFTWFVKNLFPDKIEFRNKVYTGNYIKEAYRAYVRKYEQIGKFEDEEGNTIDLLVVELLKGQSVERARTSQRNFIAQYLKNKNHREGALVAFYSEGSDDWRFSFIKMEYSLEKKKDDLTPAKRFSFLVGKDEKSHTAQNQLAGLLTMQTVPLMLELEQAFNIETVTKEFFEKYKQLFLDLNDHIEKEIKKSKQLREELESKNIDSAAFTKKLLGQIVFLYFLQKKGWLGVPKNENWGKGDKRFLRSLLDKAVSEKENFFADYLVYLFYEALATEHRGGSDSSYYKKLDCRIPFLNGGLFEADYNWEKITVDIPNKLFTNRNKTKEGDEGDGILDVFDRYNFTVKEDEPLEKEVAVDPEMLGKVFENLLEVKDRKSKGAFYTPREIVHYMCQESLIAYLDTSVNGEATSFLRMGDEQTQLFGNAGKTGQLDFVAPVDAEIVVPRKDIEKFIREGITTIEHDAAKEAGKLTSMNYGLPVSIRDNAKDLDKALAHIRICDPAIGSGAFPVGMMNEIVKAREILNTYLPNSKSRTAYEFKRHAIQECIYGVDIDHSAIDIAKLRLWLSLVVDEEDFHKIKPLPNLDYKIVEGNSLVGYPYEPQGLDIVEKLKTKFFELTDHKEKISYRKQINEAIHRLIKNTEKSLGYKVDFDFKIHFSEVFHEKKGFDVVIGNPPYGIVFDEKLKSVYEKLHKTFKRNNDVFVAFYESCSSILRKKGGIRFITPNTFLNGDYFKELRKLFTNKFTINEIVDFKESKVFQDPTVFVCIFSAMKITPSSFPYYAPIKISNEDFSSVTLKAFHVNESSDEPFKPTNKIIQKIKSVKGITLLEDLFFVKDVGFNYWSVGKGKKRDGDSIGDRILYKGVRKNKKDKPYLKGKNIFKYYNTEAENYLRHDFDDYLDGKKDVFRYSADFLEISPKLFYRQTSNRVIATIDFEKNLCDKTLHIIVPKEVEEKNIDLKYLLALLNTELFNFLYRDISQETEGRTFAQVKTVYIKQLPVLVCDEKIQKSFITIVDKILEMKKQDSTANTSLREKQIDVMVYHLYKLTFEEAKVIDAELSEEEFKKYKL